MEKEHPMSVISLTQEKWLHTLQRVIGIVDKKHTIPILSNFLLNIIDEKVELITSDSEIQVKTHLITQKNEQNFSTTVSARKILDILKSLPSEKQVSISENQNKITLQCGKSRFVLQTLPAIDFPLIHESEQSIGRFFIPQNTLKKMISKVSFSMAVNDVRYYLNGVFLVVDENKLCMVATDGHRLAYCDAELEEKISLESGLVLPRKAVIELQRLLEEKEEPVEIVFSKNQAKFIFGEIEMITKLVDGKFPDYKRVIPQNQKNEIIINRLSFLAAVQRASVLTNDKFKGVRFFIEPDLLRISSQNAEQEEAVDELDINYSGDSIEIGFNVGYVLDSILNIDSFDIKISLSDANGSALITVPGDDRFKYVVMPMRI
jgi:DNA polymerase-3 subunit beta